jgi:uncharacterized phiE125 gp8 family phage protein
MRVVETGAPAAALAELKAYLRIEDAHEDALLAGLLRAATEIVEAMLGVLLFEREVEERGPLTAGALVLSAEPARSLVAVVLEGPDGPETVTGATFEVSREGVGRLQVQGVPEASLVRVRYRAGMGADWNWVPEALRLAVLRAAAHFHAHRDGADDAGLPPAVRRMLAPWRTRRVR